MKNNFKYFSSEIMNSLVISKCNITSLKSFIYFKKLEVYLFISDINKSNILISFIALRFLSLYNMPCFIDRAFRFPKKKISFKRNWDLNFLLKLELKNFKIFEFLELFLMYFVFSKSKTYCKRKRLHPAGYCYEVSGINLNLLNFLFKVFFKFNNEFFYYVNKLRLSFLLFFSFKKQKSNFLDNFLIKRFYFKLFKL